MPRRMKTSTNLASSAMTTRSHARARCMPPPAAVPLTPAMTGFSQSRMEVTRRCQPSRIMREASPTTLSGAPSGLGRGGRRPPRRSAPLQNALSPAAVMTTTRTNRSEDASSTQSAMRSRMNWVSALPASGRLRVIQQIPSSIRRVRSLPTGSSVVSLMGLLACRPGSCPALRPARPGRRPQLRRRRPAARLVAPRPRPPGHPGRDGAGAPPSLGRCRRPTTSRARSWRGSSRASRPTGSARSGRASTPGPSGPRR